ncbi:MAG TPA: 2OG-Fe(II) oxygenase [Pyrinomonadaceae bacterium]|nr:2OG-Fe(II) oxygenase [Acidobacteriota bacterium]HQZ97650.1 2OG-Fe(II) oxygenase [Pyrinomonadaceae bacterium]
MTVGAKQASEVFSAIDWKAAADQMNAKGYSLVPRVLSREICDAFIANYAKLNYRKTVVMERHRFGIGEYKYFDYPLPDLVQTVRETMYPHLASIANQWAELLKLDIRYPANYAEFQAECHQNDQLKPTPLILKYGKGGFNTLHQDLYGAVYFPMQAALFLNEPDEDYTGGEFVLTEQVPRAQSKAIVMRPKRGDMLILTTNFRPVLGRRGFYRANVRHGVSEVTSGERHTLGVIFHDAVS